MVVHSKTPKSKGMGFGGMSKHLKIRNVDRYFELHPCWHVQQQRLFFFFGINPLKIKFSEGFSLQGVNI